MAPLGLTLFFPGIFPGLLPTLVPASTSGFLVASPSVSTSQETFGPWEIQACPVRWK